jgi:hypothetical protein
MRFYQAASGEEAALCQLVAWNSVAGFSCHARCGAAAVVEDLQVLNDRDGQLRCGPSRGDGQATSPNRERRPRAWPPQPRSSTSPAGAALATELPDDLARAYEVTATTLSPAALAYVRARGANPKSSYGGLAALSDPVDQPTATFLKGVVSDGIIAPAYHPDALNSSRPRRGAPT